MTTARVPMTAQEQATFMREGRHPYDLVKTVAGVLWECISYPYPEGNTAHVMIRVPGDPTTLRSIPAVYVSPEHTKTPREAGEFYYKEKPDRAALRAEEVARWEKAGLSHARIQPRCGACARELQPGVKLFCDQACEDAWVRRL